jgi:hypothetical protein
MTEIIIFIFSGFFVGSIAGLFGIGGGLIIVPIVTYSLIFLKQIPFNEAIIIGISTSLASIALSGAMATFAHAKNNNINWQVFKKFIGGVIIGALTIGLTINYIPTTWIKYCFIIYTFIVAFKIYVHQPSFNQSNIPNLFWSNTIGFGFSIISGLVGIGGGTLFVPYLIKKNIPPKLAVGTSSSLGLFIGLSATLGLFIASFGKQDLEQPMLGFIYLPAILFLTFPSLIFVKLSADWLLKIPDQTIKKLFSLLLITIGLLMLLT